MKVTIKRKQVGEGEKDEELYASEFSNSMFNNDDDSGTKIEPESHKENPEVVDDNEVKDNADYTNHSLVGTYATGSMETRNEQMQTPIPTPNRSHRKDLSSGKTISEELTAPESTDTVSLSTATTSKYPQKERHISSKYNHIPGALHRMCRRQGYMIKDMERKCVTTDEFWKVHGKVDQVLHEIVPQIVERATNDLIEDNLKRVVADTVIQERDAFESEVPALISKEFDAHAPKIIDLFKHYVQTSVIQVHPTINQANDLALWDVLKRKFEKSSTSNSSCRDYNFHSQHHDDHQDDDAPPEREKRVKRHKTSKISKSAKGFFIKTISQRIHYLCNQATTATTRMRCMGRGNKYSYHLEQATNFMENQIVWESRQEDIRRSIPKALNGNTEEKKYILSHHEIHEELFSEADLEEKMNRWIREVLDHCNNIVPELTFAKTNETIKEEMPRLVDLAVQKDQEIAPINNTTLNLYPTTSSSTTEISTADLQYQLYVNMKSKPQDQAADPEL
ncbi:hypothetical protein Tco_0590775 [Tanacetum coccineum]